MLFGLPWYAVIAIVSIAGGLFLRYREQELEMEKKARGSSRELNELRQMVHGLKSRIENLEAIAAEDNETFSGDIEIENEGERQDTEDASRSTKTKNR